MIILPKLIATLEQCKSVTGTDCATGLPQATASSANLHTIASMVIGIFAAVAVLIIVIAGLRLITSTDDAQKVAKARETIIYALIGLVVAILAEVIVTFTIGKTA